MTREQVEQAYDLLREIDLLREAQRRNNEHILDCWDLWKKEILSNEAISRIRDAINRELDAAITDVQQQLSGLNVAVGNETRSVVA